MPESADSRDESYYTLAREALLEVTRDDTIGEPLEVVDEGDGVSTVRFANTLPGYPGWKWTVSIAQVDGDEPTVLETELIPGDGSLLAPDWVPWAERLAEYEASAERAAGDTGDDESDDDDDSVDDDDDDDDDDPDDDDEVDDADDDDADDDDEDESDDDFDDDEYDGIDVEEAVEASHADSDDSDDEE